VADACRVPRVACRGQGLARAIVDSLVALCASFTRVYCLPYEHLVSFYVEYGFREVDPTAAEIP
jgi:predicted GNAT family N-acyltransferase